MAAKQIAFLVFMLLPAIFAAPTPLQKFLDSSFEPDQNVQTQALFAAGNYALVTADGVEAYVADAGTGTAVKDRQRLQEILSADTKNRRGFASKLSLALGLDEAVLAAKKNDEEKCVQYLGLEMHPCTDRESCIISCFSVPQCSGGPLYSDGFLEAFMDWNAIRQRFDSLILAYSNRQERMADDASAIDQKIAILDELSPLASNLSKNPIFLNRSDEGCSGGGVARCYEYCPKVDYSAEKIAAGRQNLAGLKSALESLHRQGLRAEGILNRSEQNDAYLSSRGRDYEEFRLDMLQQIRNLNESAEALSKMVLDPEVDALIGSLSNFSSGVAADGDGGLYRKALGKKPAFYAKANAISGRIASDLEARESLSGQIEALRNKTGRGAWLLGSETASYFYKDIANLTASLNSSATVEQLAGMKAQADLMDNRLDALLASRATEQGGKGLSQLADIPVGLPGQLPNPSQLPCLPAVILLTVAFAGVHRSV